MISTEVFTNVVNNYPPEPHLSLMNGILFGINLKTTRELHEKLKIAVLLHLVVLSGTNITILSSFVASSTRFFSKQLSILITILVIIIFIFFVGIKAPILRAGFIEILTLVSIQTGRKSYPLYAFLLSFVFSLLLYPKWFRSISFQLS